MSEWKKVKIGEFLKQYRNTIYVDDSQQYRQVTISSKDGVKYRCTKIGKEIGRKRQFLIDLKIHPNTVIFTRQGLYEGSIGLAPEEVDGCIATENMPMFSVDESVIDTEYLKNLLRSPIFANLVSSLTPTGSAQKSIHERDLLPLEISIPDLQTQKKIVKDISSQLEKTEQLSFEIAKQKSYAKQLRQNILQEAIEGKLTADWRKYHPIIKGNPEYDVEMLFETIQKERNLAKKQKKLPAITDEEKTFEIPEGWKWVRLGEYLDVRDGTHDSPRYVENGYPFVTSKNLINGSIDFSTCKRISKKDFEKFDLRSHVDNGDILYAMIGSIGNAVIVNKDREFAIKNVALFKKYNALLTNMSFVYYWLCFIEKNLRNNAAGSLQLFISLSIFRTQVFPLPPLAEQKEIVDRVEQYLQTITQL